MASPFSIFRRNQKIAMAVLGVAVMIAFVVFPAIIQIQQYSTGSSDNPVVLKWNGGSLNEAELASKLNTRSRMVNFLQRLRAETLKRDPDVQFRSGAGIPNSEHPQSIVQTMLLAEKAREMGIVVSDQAVVDFLADVTEGVLTADQIRKVKRDELGPKWTDAMLYAALREELLAQKVQKLALKGASPMELVQNSVTTPAAAWEVHNRMERQVTAEFVPFAVDDYVKQVASEPTSKEVQDLYEKHKGDYPMVDDPTPAFKERPKIKAEYLVADYNKFLKEEKAKVTQAQIAKYYEENKNTWRIDEEPDFGFSDPDDPRSAPPMPPVPPAEEAPPAGEEESTPPTDEGEATLPPKEEGEPGVQGEAGAAGEEATADEEPAAETTAEDKPNVELPPVTAGDDADDEDPETPESTAGDDDLTAPPKKEPKYKPLAEVEEQIIQILASEPAQKRFEAAMAAARNELRNYRDLRVLHTTDPDNEPDPGKFDYRKIAKKLGLSAGETKLVDVLDLYQDKKLELGQSYVVQQTADGQRQRVPFAALAFDDSTRLYYPVETEIAGEKAFLTWKVEEQEARVPKLEEIRDEVEAAWKRVEARKLAKAAAEKLAAEVNGKKPLKDQVEGDEKVLTPPPFTYYVPISLLMFRFQGQQPQWEEIQGVEDGTSDAIKKRVFALPVGGVDVAENAAKSIYYVVRVAGDDGQAASRTKFMQSIVDNPLDGAPPELRYLGASDQMALIDDWNEQIDKEFGVEWVDKDYLERFMGR